MTDRPMTADEARLILYLAELKALHDAYRPDADPETLRRRVAETRRLLAPELEQEVEHVR